MGRMHARIAAACCAKWIRQRHQTRRCSARARSNEADRPLVGGDFIIWHTGIQQRVSCPAAWTRVTVEDARTSPIFRFLATYSRAQTPIVLDSVVIYCYPHGDGIFPLPRPCQGNKKNSRTCIYPSVARFAKAEGAKPEEDGIRPKNDGITHAGDEMTQTADGITPKPNGIMQRRDGIAPTAGAITPQVSLSLVATARAHQSFCTASKSALRTRPPPKMLEVLVARGNEAANSEAVGDIMRGLL
jgi:hypothetical protein